MTAPTAVGIDVGATKAEAVRVTVDGTVHARARAQTPATDVPGVLEAMRSVAAQVLDPSTTAIGVGAAGLVERATGRMRFAPNIAWRDVDLAAELAVFGLPASIDNDCTTATVGELLAGAGRGVEDFVYVGLGTGIGGGLVLGGAVQRGAHGFAGEVGHIIVEPGGVVCGCGNRGCWETVASGTTITRLGRERLGVDGQGVVAAAARGDGAAQAILDEVGLRLGQGIAGLVNVLDPEVVIVGGGPAAAGDLLLGPARRACRDAIEGADVRPEVPIVPAALGGDAAAIGAALWAMREAA
ncbi:MAG: ROK family protein [Actinomycetota bacterium]|jgi:glucokinase